MILTSSMLLGGPQLGAAAAAAHGHLGRTATQAFAAAAACCEHSLLVEAVGLACGPPPGTAAPPYTPYSTRRLHVPTHCLAVKAKQRKRLGGDGGTDDELGGGGGGGESGGGDDYWGGGGGDPLGDSGGGQDFLLAWAIFCALAFVGTAQHLTTPAKSEAAFAAINFTLLKSQLAQLQGGCRS